MLALIRFLSLFFSALSVKKKSFNTNADIRGNRKTGLLWVFLEFSFGVISAEVIVLAWFNFIFSSSPLFSFLLVSDRLAVSGSCPYQRKHVCFLKAVISNLFANEPLIHQHMLATRVNIFSCPKQSVTVIAQNQLFHL